MASFSGSCRVLVVALSLFAGIMLKMMFCFQHKVKGSLRSESIVRTKRVCVSGECSNLSRQILQNIDPEQVRTTLQSSNTETQKTLLIDDGRDD